MGFYSNQLKALIKRNILLKKTSKAQTLIEIILPISMVIVTYFVNRVTKTQVYNEIGASYTNDVNSEFLDYTFFLKQDNSKVPTIGFVLPKNNDGQIIDKFKANDIFKDSVIDFKNFKNQNEMNEFNNDYHNLLLAGIIFETDDLFHYTLRVNSTSAPDPTTHGISNYIESRHNAENSETDADKYSYLFTPIQAAVDQAIIRLKTNDDTITLKHNIGKMGKARSIYENSGNGGNFGFYISMTFLMPVIIIGVSLVKEKEDGIKVGLLMAGTHPTLFWLSWLILYFIICFVISLIVTIIFQVTSTFSNVNPIIMFLALLLYGLSCCNSGFVVSTFFNKTKTAGSVVGIFFTVFAYANFTLSIISMTLKKIFSIVICQLAIGSFIYEVDEMENRFEELTFSNLFKTNAGFFFISLIINNILYFGLAILFDNLFLSEGSSYLFNFNKNVKIMDEEMNETNEKDIQEDYNAKNGEKCMVEVSQVFKIFSKKKSNDDENERESGGEKSKKKKGKKFMAVNNVSFKVYQNEIFALLGHNGAGKTTLINIMVGLLKASQGDVFFDGLRISKDTNTIRKNFGVCAQTNTIFENLTVEDHIKFFAELKNVTVDVDEVLKDIDLIQQKQLKASKLSGGQKRKLCIGMATIGNPKYIFLDEPTTGLDPLSRRKIWDLLVKKKEGRVIFLTTHYMDEADILADRKLILSKGKIRCLGTSLFLKNHFNMNYDLVVETSDKDRVHGIIRNYLTDFTYVNDTDDSNSNSNLNSTTESNSETRETSDIVVANKGKGGEMVCHTWRLPLNATDKFSHLLNDLEREMDQDKGFVKKYALNMPTLEELFIRLEDNTIDEDEEVDKVKSDDQQLLINMNDTDLPELKPVQSPSSIRLIYYLFKSRLMLFIKDRAFAFFATIFPALITGGMFFMVQRVFNSESKSTNSNILSVDNIYSGSYLNFDPQSQLAFTKDDLMNAVGPKGASMVTSLSLSDIKNPEVDQPYYISSLSGKMDSTNIYNFQIHYNDSMVHSLPTTFNAISNAVLASKNINEQIVMTAHPFGQRDEMMSIIGLSIAGFMIGYYMANNINRFGPLVVRERVNQILQQLQLNGVSRLNYWISSFITDIFLYLFTCLLIFIIGIIVRYEPLLDIKILFLIIVLLLIWCVPAMLYQYCTSFLFKKEDTAFSMSSFLNTYPAIFGYMIFFLINSNYNVVDSIFANKGIISVVGNIYNMLLSAVCPAYGFVAMVNSLFTMKLYHKIINYDMNFSNIFKFSNGILPILMILVVLAVFYFFLLLFLDRKINQTNKSDIYTIPEDVLQSHQRYMDEGDEDVKDEFQYVESHQMELPLSVLHLSKEYKTRLPDNREKKAMIMARDPINYNFGEIHKSGVTGKYVKTAVIDVSFGVRTHECFGLLGPNGAGKSTTLNTVTSTIPQTTGKVCFNGVETHLARLGEISMGYCPQTDILWKELTLREHLELFLNIRGYNTEESKAYATKYINALGLEEHQHKRANDLSGGTKRKLSLLIAICGYPKQILLDEPSAGMDPSTRRLVWNVIKKTKTMNDSAVILTTHSMEEAEFLCDRLAILVNGHLSCIGSPEHLKMKYGDSYILELQSKDIDRFHQVIIEEGRLFGDMEYKQEKSSNDRTKYEVKMTRNIGHVFEVMEKCKKDGMVNDYSFNQTTLEQIFINFAKNQIITTE